MFSKRTDWQLEDNAITRLLKELRSAQAPVIDLTESNPTQVGFSFYQDDLLKPLIDLAGLTYTPDAKGSLAARKTISGYYLQMGIDVSPEQIFLTSGTSEAYSAVMKLMINTGESVLGPKPSYPLLEYLTGLSDAALKDYPLLPENNWAIDFNALSASLSKSDRLLVVINPNNPTGTYLKRRELDRLNDILDKRKMALVSDEVFFDYRHSKVTDAVSTAGNQKVLTFTLSGISKVLALPQMKLGWIVVSGPNKLAKEACSKLEVILDSYLSVNSPVQNALPDWFKQRETTQQEILERVRKNKNILEETVCKIKNCKLVPVEGGWYGLLKLAGVKNEEEFVLNLLRKERVLVHPGYFYDFPGEGFLMMSLIVRRETFREGMGRVLRHASS